MSLRKKGRETDAEVLEFINSISPSFCAAKWYNATIWLGSGMTTSCHHPPAHYVPIDEVTRNYKALHNTKEKKLDRLQMQRGERPASCQYCWVIEDSGVSACSDRQYKSVIYEESDLIEASHLPHEMDVDLKTLEISFDRTCNFACSYCNPAFSTTWVKDIANKGPYQNLVSDGRNHYTHTHDDAQKFKPTETNPYVEAFFKWWEADLHRTLMELRITGGEPLMSAEFWRLLDWFKENESDTKLAVNSNLIGKRVWEFIDRTNDLAKPIDLYTSGESFGFHAEYIRDGLKWNEWVGNLQYARDYGNIRAIHVMCTINALCLESLPEFLTYLDTLKNGMEISFTLNILRFPSFQSPLILPIDMRIRHANRLKEWLTTATVSEMERNHVLRLIEYLEKVDKPHDEAFDLPKLRADFKNFYTQYDERRGKNFDLTFPRLAEWKNSL